MPTWKEHGDVKPWTMKGILIGDPVDLPHIAGILKETEDRVLREELLRTVERYSPNARGAAELVKQATLVGD